jgi:hypothetical protein
VFDCQTHLSVISSSRGFFSVDVLIDKENAWLEIEAQYLYTYFPSNVRNIRKKEITFR